LAAFRNAGAWVLTVAGRLIPTPRPPGPKNGSGKFRTPWERMQCAFATIASIRACEIPAVAPRPPSDRHVFVAAWNAGPLKLMPSTVTEELLGDFAIEKPSPPGPKVGSGKFGTPWARMHLASATCGFGVELCVDTVFGVELPHAARAAAQLTAATSALQTRRGDLLGELLVCAAGMMETVLWLAGRVGFYGSADNRGGTLLHRC
jgi:hypothetical protein